MSEIKVLDANGTKTETDKLANYIANKTNIPREILTEQEMDNILLDGINNIGKAYLYTGPDAGPYKNGNIYVVEESEGM